MENIEKQGQLSPCPFCGGEASRRYTDSHPKGQEKLHIECDVCNARTDWQYSRAKLCVEDWWNQRTETAAELRWIPVKTKYPDLPGVYDVTLWDGTISKSAYYVGTFDKSVIAWMPLPTKPYTEPAEVESAA